MQERESRGQQAAGQEPLVSVILPVYGVEAYLERCVDGVPAQTYRNLEVILVDDESPDRCPAICDAYATDQVIAYLVAVPVPPLKKSQHAQLQYALFYLCVHVYLLTVFL